MFAGSVGELGTEKTDDGYKCINKYIYIYFREIYQPTLLCKARPKISTATISKAYAYRADRYFHFRSSV